MVENITMIYLDTVVALVAIKKRKRKVDLNVEEIVLHQVDLVVVIDQYQRKDVQ